MQLIFLRLNNCFNTPLDTHGPAAAVAAAAGGTAAGVGVGVDQLAKITPALPLLDSSVSAAASAQVYSPSDAQT